MFPSALQRDTSAHRLSYPRLIHCDVAFQPGPKPIPIPRLPPQALLTTPPPSLDWSTEQRVIDEVRQRRQAEADAAAVRQRRALAEERRRRETEEAEARRLVEVAAERQKRQDEERKEAEGTRKRHELEQEKLRHIAEAYKKQRAAVEAFAHKPHNPPTPAHSLFLALTRPLAVSVHRRPPHRTARQSHQPPSATHPLLSGGGGGGGSDAANAGGRNLLMRVQ